MSVESAEFQVALDALVAAHCDRVRLAWLLSSLGNAAIRRSISKEQLGDIARDMERAAKGVRRLYFCQLGHRLGLDSLRLVDELRDLATNAKALAPQAHARRPMYRDLIRATLVHYAHETTGQFYDDHVAALISVAESNAIDGRLVDPNAEEVAIYTMEAHTQWRHRPACQDLLNGPSDEVRELLAAMNEAVRD